MSSSRDIFTKISDPSEKDRIFHDLCVSPSEIIAKPLSPQSETLLLKAEVFVGNELACSNLSKHSPPEGPGELILQITLGAEKYLCSTPYILRGKRIYLNTNTEVFHLQRREDFRLRLPVSYKATFELRTVNQKPRRARLQIIDISGGGCKVLVTPTPPAFNISDQVSGEIHLPDRPTISISGQIRHEDDDQHAKSQVVGIQFTNMPLPVRNRLAALVMDLYRQLFSRLT